MRRASTIINTDVVQLGIISKIHMRAANTKRAIVRCCRTVSPSIPKKVEGTARRKIVISSTNGSSTQYFTENLLVLIIICC
jgi:hypothetical protein